MSEQQNLPVESAGTGDCPPAKRTCTIDTPPVAGTPDDGSDFYNTPLGAGTPVTGTGLEQTVLATETPVTSQPAPVIPGLGFVNNPNEQPTTNEPSQPAAATTQEKPVSADSQVFADSSIPENLKATVETNGQQETSGDAMEIDQKTVPGTPGASNGASTEQPNTEPQEQEQEHPEWEIDSDPYESSSEDSSSSDSSDSDDDEDYPILSPEEQARILMLAEGGSDDEGGDKGKSGEKIRSTNEIDEDALPIPDIEVTPDMKIVPLGKVQTAIENAVLIEASTSGEYQVLESGSLLCSEDRKVLGVVSETLGRVENPLYTVMYKTADEAQERGMVKDLPVYYVEAHSTFVFTQPLKGMKGSDASNFHDEEVAEDEIEFSDDEAEAEYKRKLKQKRQERKEAKEGGPARGKKAPPGPSKLSHTELNYDDGAAEDGYTPLARPKNLYEMMGAREAPVEGTERGGPGFRGGRGRGRGADRGGRGGRGRGGAGRGGSWDRDQDHRPHHQQNGNTSQYGQQAAPPQTQPPAPYGLPAYQQQQPAYSIPQPFAGYPQYPQQQQPQFGQGHAPAPFPFQFPFQQPFAQPNPFQAVPPGAHINPLFLAALQQQQQQQYQQPQQQYQQPQQTPGQAQPQNPAAMNFDQVKAQLDLLRQLSNGNQGPPSS